MAPGICAEAAGTANPHAPTDGPSTSAAFYTLPIEINQAIGLYLDTAEDILAFRDVCSATRNAVDGDHSSFWRYQYRKNFAMLTNTTNEEMRQKFLIRRKLLSRGLGLDFTRGHSKTEQLVLAFLRDLIKESFLDGRKPFVANVGTLGCPNMVQLDRYMTQSTLLVGGKRPARAMDDEKTEMHNLLSLVRLMGSHFVLSPDTVPGAWCTFDEAQKMAYSEIDRDSLFEGPSKNLVNLTWAVHCMAFFRHYMTIPSASALYDTMSDLMEGQEPTPWKGPIADSHHTMGKHWKGVWAALDSKDLSALRRGPNSRSSRRRERTFEDYNIDEGNIENFTFEFPTEGEFKWPAQFEHTLQSLREPVTQRRTRSHASRGPEKSETALANKGFRLEVANSDTNAVEYYATGWLNELPDQLGVPGWQRITFMRHDTKDSSQADQNELYGYEGVVLPGARIILGRWFDPARRSMSGPFMLWAVDAPVEFQDEDEDEDNKTSK